MDITFIKTMLINIFSILQTEVSFGSSFMFCHKFKGFALFIKEKFCLFHFRGFIPGIYNENYTAYKIEQLKKRIKTAAIVSGVALSSLGLSQNAAAQTSHNNSKSTQDIETKTFNPETKKLETGDGLYTYFYADGGDNGIYIEAKDLAKCLDAANVTGDSAESKKFVDLYMKHIDNNGKITCWNFNKVLQESLQPQQVQAFCDSLHEIFKAKEAKQEQKDVKTIHAQNANIQYSIGEKGISIGGNVAIDVNNLMPPVYQLQNGTYKCGTAISQNLSMVREMEAANLRQVVMGHYVYNDLRN